MGLLAESLGAAFGMIFSGNAELWSIVLLSLGCTLAACLVAGFLGVPLAFFMTQHNFTGKRFCLVVLNSLQALPTVVVGLLVYVFISRRGIFGAFDLLYTPVAITIGQAVLLFPLVTVLALAALSRLDKKYREIAMTLGASTWQANFAVMREARFALLAAICVAFGRGIAEVGVSMMLGGNIKGFTRTMTTAMALEFDRGEFTLALALGVVLLLVSFALNALLSFFQGHTK